MSETSPEPSVPRKPRRKATKSEEAPLDTRSYLAMLTSMSCATFESSLPNVIAAHTVPGAIDLEAVEHDMAFLLDMAGRLARKSYQALVEVGQEALKE